jgi:hypothetical protein
MNTIANIQAIQIPAVREGPGGTGWPLCAVEILFHV